MILRDFGDAKQVFSTTVRLSADDEARRIALCCAAAASAEDRDSALATAYYHQLIQMDARFGEDEQSVRKMAEDEAAEYPATLATPIINGLVKARAYAQKAKPELFGAKKK
ncbi:MAG: hypothetical protein ACAH88_20235, partial [Roseimicrobium sp.]